MKKDIWNWIAYLWDCLDVMDLLIQEWIKVDAIITDPPYLLDNHWGWIKTRELHRNLAEKHIDFISNSFNEIILEKMLKLCNIPNILLFCSNKQISWLMNFFENKKLSTTLLIWNKYDCVPFWNWKYIEDIEFIIYVRWKKAPFNNLSVAEKSKVKRFSKSEWKRLHPTQKPISLLDELIKTHSNEWNIVLDCFAWSFTTAVACENTNRKWICIEKDENYFNIWVNRIWQKN